MAKWTVEITITRVVLRTVDARDWSEARHASALAGERLFAAQPPEKGETRWFSVDPKVQIGEPWVHAYWIDMHGKPGDVVLAKRAHGHVFSRADIRILRARLAKLGLEVVDHWNGAGYTEGSFKCTGRRNRRRDFSRRELAVLVAPRR